MKPIWKQWKSGVDQIRITVPLYEVCKRLPVNCGADSLHEVLDVNSETGLLLSFVFSLNVIFFMATCCEVRR